ncbi:BrnT family toxin [Porticoccus sp.]
MNSFEYDSKKSLSNKDKHDIDFEEAQVLWEDPDLLEVQATSEDESRYLVIGKIADKHWSAVITYRKGNIRIISVRRSRETEVAIYES